MPKPTIKVFISCARQHDHWVLAELLTVLNHIQQRPNAYELEIWPAEDPATASGSSTGVWELLNRADIVLCLITQHYFRSEYIREIERPLIEEKCRLHQPVIPIIIQHTPYEKEWLYPYHLPVLPMGLRQPLESSSHRLVEMWRTIDLKLSLRFNSIAQRQRLAGRRLRERQKRIAREKAKETLGIWPVLGLFFWLGVIAAGVFLQTQTVQEPPTRGSLYLDLSRIEQLDYDPAFHPGNSAAEALFSSEPSDDEEE